MAVDFGPIQRLLERMAPVLERRGVRYAIVGGVAVNLLGEMRETRDLDCSLALTAEDAPGIGRELERAGFVVTHHGGPDAPMARWIRLHQPEGEPPLKADLILALDDLWQDAVTRARPVKVGSRTYPVAAPENLILLKLKARGIQDVIDCASVMKVQKLRGTPVDIVYLDREAERWGLGDRWRQIRDAMLG